jgi:hypothetical protein
MLFFYLPLIILEAMLGLPQHKLAMGCPSGPFYYENIATVVSYAKEKPTPLEYAIEPFSYGALASVTSAAVVYFGFWLLGWLCAGFTRD